MKALFEKFLFDILHSTKISLAVLIAVLIFLTPAFTGVTGFVQEAWANTRRISDLEHRIQKIDMVDDKLNLLMLEIGVSKNKIELIEQHYLKRKGE